jgi:hypothetical protein
MMLGHKPPMSRKAAALLLIAAASFSLAGCAGGMKSLNPFAEKDKVLPGERRPVFAPGTDFSGPRKLPPPGSDYVGATMPASQPVTQAAPPSPTTPTTPKATGTQSVPPAPPAPPTGY